MGGAFEGAGVRESRVQMAKACLLLVVIAAQRAPACVPAGKCPLIALPGYNRSIADGEPVALASLRGGVPPVIRWSLADSAASYDLDISDASGAVVWAEQRVVGGELLRGHACAPAWAFEPAAAGVPTTFTVVLRDQASAAVAASTTFQTARCDGATRVAFAAGAAACGATLSATTAVDVAPTAVAITDDASAALYALLMLDGDALSWQSPELSPILHGAWGNVPSSPLSSSAPLNGSDTIASYMAPAGLGRGSYAAFHRYHFAAFAQPAGGPIAFTPIADGDDRMTFDVAAFVARYSLGGGAQSPYGAAGYDYLLSGAALGAPRECDGALNVSFGGGAPPLACGGGAAVPRAAALAAPLVACELPRSTLLGQVTS